MLEATCHCGAVRIEVDAPLESVTQLVGSISGAPFNPLSKFEIVLQTTRRMRLTPPRGRCCANEWRGLNERFSASASRASVAKTCRGMTIVAAL